MDKLDSVNVEPAVKEKLRFLLSALKCPDIFKPLGIDAPQSLLLEGDCPWLGRDLVQAFIAECGLPVFTVRVKQRSDSLNFPKNARKVFKEAKKKAPSLLFIDGLDPSNGSSSDYDNIEALLAPLKKAKDTSVFVVVNLCVWRLSLGAMVDDPEGMCDVQIFLKTPEKHDRVAFMERELKKWPCSGVLAEDLVGLVCPISDKDYSLFFRQAAYHAALAGRHQMESQDFVAVIENSRSSNAPEEMSLELQEKTALHEAGHLLIDELLSPGSVNFVHLGDDGDTLGYCSPNFLGDSVSQILSLLGGKASVEMTYGGIAEGCDGDLKKVQELLFASLCERGYPGFLLLRDITTYSKALAPSPEQALILTYEMERYLAKAKELIAANRPFLEGAAHKLVQQHFLLISDIAQLRKDYPFDASPLKRLD